MPFAVHWNCEFSHFTDVTICDTTAMISVLRTVKPVPFVCVPILKRFVNIVFKYLLHLTLA